MYLGIDPGCSGGIGLINAEHVMMNWKMPETERDLSDIIEQLAPLTTFCLIEGVHSLPKQGVKSVFTFGRNYGFLRGLLIAHKIPFEDVSPSKWQTAMRVKSIKDEPKTAHKNRLKALAQQLFPLNRITLDTADASLIAEYVYRIKTGMLPEVPKEDW